MRIDGLMQMERCNNHASQLRLAGSIAHLAPSKYIQFTAVRTQEGYNLHHFTLLPIVANGRSMGGARKDGRGMFRVEGEGGGGGGGQFSFE